MKKLKSYIAATFLLTGLLAAWFLTGNLLGAPPVQAQGKSDKTWETLVVRGGALPEGLQGVLNSKGGEGWELVEVIQTRDGNYVAFLKRRKQ